MNVAPFAQAEVGDELRAAAFDDLAMRQLLGERVGKKLPQRDERQEIGALVAKLEMGLIGRLGAFQRTLTRIGSPRR